MFSKVFVSRLRDFAAPILGLPACLFILFQCILVIVSCALGTP